MTASAQAVVVQDVQLPQVSNATSLLQAITLAASNPATDIEKMERLFAMHQTMVKMEAETAFNAAMARAQSQMTTVVRNAKNSHTGSTYATLAGINDAIMPIATAEGFSVSFDTADSPVAGYIRTIALVSHASGHTRTHHNDMPLDDTGSGGKVNKTKIQASGSTQSYARRYLVCQIFNVTTEDDNDGNKRTHSATDGAGQRVNPERRQAVQELASRMKAHLSAGAVEDAVLEEENFSFEDADETVFMWTFFTSKERSSMKVALAALRARPPLEGYADTVAASKAETNKIINDAQRIRLEAMISERGLDREAIKKMVYDEFAKDHFKDLSPDEYETICAEVEKSSAPSPRQPTESAVLTQQTAGATDAEPTDASLVTDIEGQVKRKKFDFANDLCRGIKDPVLRENTEKRIANAKAFVDAKQG